MRFIKQAAVGHLPRASPRRVQPQPAPPSPLLPQTSLMVYGKWLTVPGGAIPFDGRAGAGFQFAFNRVNKTLLA